MTTVVTRSSSSNPIPADSSDYRRFSGGASHVVGERFYFYRASPLIQRPFGKIIDELSFEEGLYEMANLRPQTTGLPFVVFISQRGGAQHDVRVKISREPLTREFIASVSVRGEIEIKEGDLPNAELEQLKQWIELNREVLVGFWDGTIQYTEEAIAQIQSI